MRRVPAGGHALGAVEGRGAGHRLPEGPAGARRRRVRRQRDRDAARVRGFRALPRRPGRALLRPPGHGAVRGGWRGARARPRRSVPRPGGHPAQVLERRRRRPDRARRRRQGRLRRARRPSRRRCRPRPAPGVLERQRLSVDGLMMDFQLTLPPLLRRAEAYFPGKRIVTRLPDKSFHRYTYADFGRRSRQLAVALQELGLERGDRVATLCWNHHQHLEAYFGIPCGGFVLHTLNLRLHPNDLAFIADHACDRAVIVDAALLPLLDLFKDRTKIEHVFVVEGSYEELLASADPDAWRDPELDETEAAAMCYTSGTTGLPKGVLYSHRSTVLHTLGVAAGNPLGRGISEEDVVLPVVPMFHANAWGYPYLATMLGAGQVYPGPHLDPESLLDDFVQEGVTWTAGVPTIWL